MAHKDTQWSCINDHLSPQKCRQKCSSVCVCVCVQTQGGSSLYLLTLAIENTNTWVDHQIWIDNRNSQPGTHKKEGARMAKSHLYLGANKPVIKPGVFENTEQIKKDCYFVWQLWQCQSGGPDEEPETGLWCLLGCRDMEHPFLAPVCLTALVSGLLLYFTPAVYKITSVNLQELEKLLN